MLTSNIVQGGCTQPAGGPSASSGGQSTGSAGAIVGAVGGLAQAAMNGNLVEAAKKMAIDAAKKELQQAATALLTKLVSAPVAPKPPLPPRPAKGIVAPAGSAAATLGSAIISMSQELNNRNNPKSFDDTTGGKGKTATDAKASSNAERLEHAEKARENALQKADSAIELLEKAKSDIAQGDLDSKAVRLARIYLGVDPSDPDVGRDIDGLIDFYQDSKEWINDQEYVFTEKKGGLATSTPGSNRTELHRDFSNSSVEDAGETILHESLHQRGGKNDKVRVDTNEDPMPGWLQNLLSPFGDPSNTVIMQNHDDNRGNIKNDSKPTRADIRGSADPYSEFAQQSQRGRNR